MKSNSPASLWGWYGGLPVYHPELDEYVFMEMDPVDIADLMEYRQNMLSQPDFDFAAFEILSMMIESQMSVQAVLNRVITSS